MDDIEQKLMPQSFFDDSALPEDKYELPAVMWEQAINKYPNRGNINKLKEKYPMFLIQKLVKLSPRLFGFVPPYLLRLFCIQPIDNCF